jgi:hypothetical protein
MSHPHVAPSLRIVTNPIKLLARRTTVDWNVTAGHPTKGSVRGRVVNISITGLLMQIPASYAQGAVLEVVLRPAPHEPIRAFVQIVRREPKTDGSFLYGACFTRMSDEAYYHLREMILLLRDRVGSDCATKPSGLTCAR